MDGRLLLAVATALFLGSFTLFMIDSQIATDNAKLVIERDSLKSECSVKDIEIGRYEYVYDQLDTVCKTQVDKILSNTE
jgi:hypothetical protein